MILNKEYLKLSKHLIFNNPRGKWVSLIKLEMKKSVLKRSIHS